MLKSVWAAMVNMQIIWCFLSSDNWNENNVTDYSWNIFILWYQYQPSGAEGMQLLQNPKFPLLGYWPFRSSFCSCLSITWSVTNSNAAARAKIYPIHSQLMRNAKGQYPHQSRLLLILIRIYFVLHPLIKGFKSLHRNLWILAFQPANARLVLERYFNRT